MIPSSHCRAGYQVVELDFSAPFQSDREHWKMLRSRPHGGNDGLAGDVDHRNTVERGPRRVIDENKLDVSNGSIKTLPQSNAQLWGCDLLLKMFPLEVR